MINGAVYNLDVGRFVYDKEKQIVHISSDDSSEIPRFRDSVLVTLEGILEDKDIMETSNDEKQLYDNIDTNAGNPILRVRVYALTSIAFAVISVDPEYNPDLVGVIASKDELLEYLFSR